ncbi:MAG: hypothetical protein COA50_16990 [Flavobacteriaceae bacterium]|nr:MAG: hypothetical protein COA50_16990 [Flavobacteriaceae bacterium]
MKNSIPYFLFILCSITVYSQEPQKMVYSIFEILEKDTSHCNSAIGYETQMLPIRINSELRQKVIKKREISIENSTNTKVVVWNLFLSPNDWVVILEADYKMCDGNVKKKIFRIKAKNKADIDTLIHEDIHVNHSAIEDDYISHNVLYTGQPYRIEEENFHESTWNDLKYSLLKWLNEDEKKEFKKEYEKATGIGVRG